MTDILGQALNGLAYGALLFLLSVGLTLIFGMLDVVNLAHGSFYMLGAYAGLATLTLTGNFWLAAITAPLAVGLVGALVERGLLRPLYRRSPLDQVLLTFGLIYLFEDLVKWGWGGRIRSIPPPELFSGRVTFNGFTFPAYRLFVIGFGLLLAILLWLVIEKTRAGRRHPSRRLRRRDDGGPRHRHRTASSRSCSPSARRSADSRASSPGRSSPRTHPWASASSSPP